MSTTVTASKRHLEINATEFAGQLDGTIKTSTTATTQSTSDNTTKVATTAFVKAQGYITTQSDTQNLTIDDRTISLTDGGSVTVPQPSYSAITGKPATFAPIIGGGSNQALAGNTSLFDGAWGSLSGRPTVISSGQAEAISANSTHAASSHAPANATNNSSNATLLARANHTGTQAYSTITGTPTIPSGNAIIDWTSDQGGTNIHAGNYTDTNTNKFLSDIKKIVDKYRYYE
jgi:hypothetical protein